MDIMKRPSAAVNTGRHRTVVCGGGKALVSCCSINPVLLQDRAKMHQCFRLSSLHTYSITKSSSSLLRGVEGERKRGKFRTAAPTHHPK